MLDLLLTLPPATSLPFASVHCATRKAQAKEKAQRQRGKEAWPRLGVFGYACWLCGWQRKNYWTVPKKVKRASVLGKRV